MDSQSGTLRSRSHPSGDGVLWLVLTLFAVFYSSDALATSIAEVKFGEMCHRAESIFWGTCVGIESRRDVSSGNIYTYTRFEDVEWVKGEIGSSDGGSSGGGSGDGGSSDGGADAGGPGENGSTFELRTFGGEVDDERLTVQGMPRFEIGKRYVLFVQGNYRNVCPVIGWHQGCFGLEQSGENSSATGRSVLLEGDAQEAPSDSVPEYDTVVTWDGRRVSLSAFLEAVRAERSAVEDAEQAAGGGETASDEAGGQP